MFIELFISFFEKNLVFYKSTEISFNYLIKVNSLNCLPKSFVVDYRQE